MSNVSNNSCWSGCRTQNWCLIRIILCAWESFSYKANNGQVIIHFQYPSESKKNSFETFRYRDISYTHLPPSWTYEITLRQKKKFLFMSCLDWHLRSLMKMQFYACFVWNHSILRAHTSQYNVILLKDFVVVIFHRTTLWRSNWKDESNDKHISFSLQISVYYLLYILIISIRAKYC